MAQITDAPPEFVQAELDALDDSLGQVIPPKHLDQNVLIATWNIRSFGGLTEQWEEVIDGSPKRNLHALACVAAIISRFDVIAIQEVTGNLKALRHMLKLLGRHWSFILTDVTRGNLGNNERIAFLFDTRKVTLSGLACELVIPEDEAIDEGAFVRQFVRTPYAVAFQSAGHTFILVTVHIFYGSSPQDRLGELEAIAEWLDEWSKEANAWSHDLIVLGDFNIDHMNDPLYQAFTSTGLLTPEDLNAVPRTIFSSPDEPDKAKFYDQIAWFTDGHGYPRLSMVYSRSGSFDFTKDVMTSLNNQKLTWRMSGISGDVENRIPQF